MGRLKYTDEELVQKIIELQTATPKMTEAGICSALGVARDYLSERAKDSADISDARKRAHAIREEAWVKKGIDIVDGKSRFQNGQQATIYIWMTRNILGWRDRDPENTQSAQGAIKKILLAYDPAKKKETGEA